MATRDERGRFLPGSTGRPSRPPEELRTTMVGVRVTGSEAELAHAAASRRGTTISSLIRAFLRRLLVEDGHRIR